MNKFGLFVLLICVLLISSLAQEEKVPEITVQVEVEAEKEKVLRTESITAEEAQKMAGIQNISDVLNRLPGTEGIYGCVMASPRLTIRSSSFALRQVLVEGMNVNPIISCVLDRVPWTSIEKVDVFKAPLPPSFIGSLSGVVSVSLKNGSDYPGAFASLSVGDYNTLIYQLSAGGGNEKRNYFLAFNRTVGNEWREKMRTDLSDLSFKLVTEGEEGKWTIAGAMLQGEQDGFKPTGPNPADRWGQRWPAMQRPALSITYLRELNGSSSLQLRIAPVAFRSELHYYRWDPTKGEVVPMVTLLRYNLLRSELTYDFTPSSDVSNSIGIWWQGDWRRSTVPSEEPLLGEWRKQDMRRKGIFFQSRRALGERRSLFWGLGYEEASIGGEAFVPFLSYNWQRGTNDRFRISMGHNKLFPTLEELFGGGCFIGNPNLKPTSANSFQLDWERTLNNGKLTASLFYSKLKDVIGNDKDGKYWNISRVSEQGVELSYERQLGKTSLWANYTYLDAWDLEHDRFFIPTYRTSEPRHTLKAGVTFNGKNGFSYGAELFYWGKRATDANGRAEWWYGAEGGPTQVIVPKTVPSATIFNLKISKQLANGRSISLSMQNLFDKKWEEIVFYPQAGRWMLLELSQQF